MSRFTKTIYLLLLILLIAQPHFITGHVFFIPQVFAQSLANVLLIGIAYGVYRMHRKDIERKQREKEQMEQALELSSSQLSDAYRYIGSINRRLPLLKAVTTGLLAQPKRYKNGKRLIFEELLATAVVSLARAPWGVFRFINTNTGRTEREFIHTAKNYLLLKTTISNKKLLNANEMQWLEKIDGRYVLPTSDFEAAIRCFFIFSEGENNIENEKSTLQAIVDQAQLFYQYLYGSFLRYEPTQPTTSS